MMSSSERLIRSFQDPEIEAFPWLVIVQEISNVCPDKELLGAVILLTIKSDKSLLSIVMVSFPLSKSVASAVIVTVWLSSKLLSVTPVNVKLTEDWLTGIVTVWGTSTSVISLEVRVTTNSLELSSTLRVIVPVDVWPS